MSVNKYKAVFLLGIAALPVTSGAQGPNFILFIADDVSWNDLGCYGNCEVRTPVIDSLARQGLRFDNFFLTASSSSPSRNCIITGRYPHNTGAAELHTEPPLAMVSFPEVLRRGGYYTAQAGKFHLGEYARRGFQQLSEDFARNGDGGEEQWLNILKERPKEKPFMFWFASYDAHRPWGVNEFSGTHKPLATTPPFYLADAAGTKTDMACYYDEIARFDNSIGLVVRELEAQHVLENTIIIIMADNGRPFPHSKTRVNDRGLKTPFIIFWPGSKGIRAKVCNSLVSSVDIAATVLDLAKVNIPETVQGVSFVRLLEDPRQDFRTHVFAEHNWHDYEAHERMVRTNDFLYILNSRPQFPDTGPLDAISSGSYIDLFNLRNKGEITSVQADIFLAPRPAEELYNNSTDPDQFVNLADNPLYRTRLTELRNDLKEWMDETGDNIPETLTKDWYLRESETIKTGEFGKRGEMPGQAYKATSNNNKGRF